MHAIPIILWKDPWCNDVPMALKPTYINMHCPLETLHSKDFVRDNDIDIGQLQQLLGHHADMDKILSIHIVSSGANLDLDASWIDASSNCVLTFIVISNSYCTILVGAIPAQTESSVATEVVAIAITLKLY